MEPSGFRLTGGVYSPVERLRKLAKRKRRAARVRSDFRF